MSWNGMKPTLSKEEVRGLLPGAACKSMVYLVRVFLTEFLRRMSRRRSTWSFESVTTRLSTLGT
jgi:hypothetical protein